MTTPAPDEKTSMVMVYTQTALIHGEVVTKQSMRVSVWLRTEGAPEYIHLFKPNVVTFTSSPAKVLNYSEIYLPATQIIGFHLTPPAQDPMDYDEGEMNRIMKPVTVLVGTFIFNGHLRVSTQVELGTSIATAHSAWMSIYNVSVTNPNLPQMGDMRVPFLIVRPSQVGFALQAA